MHVANDSLRQEGPNSLRIMLRDHSLHRLEQLLDTPPRVESFACAQNRRMRCRYEMRTNHKLFEHLLTRTKSCEHNLDITVRIRRLANRAARKSDHVAREVHDANRLAHVEHEDFAALAESASLKDQPAPSGLRNSCLPNSGKLAANTAPKSTSSQVT